MSFPRRVEHALDVPVRCPHDTDAGEHRRPAERCHQHLFSEPSFRFSRGPKRSPSQHFARVRRAGVVEGLSCYLPMRLVPIGKPHVHHERISVVGAFNPIGARLWFQSHRDKSHFPNCPMGGENLRLEGTSALRSGRRRRIAPGTQSKRFGFVPRGTQSFAPAGVPGVTAPRAFPQRNPLSGSRPGIHSRTSYSNATPSGSFSSNHVSAATGLANTLR